MAKRRQRPADTRRRQQADSNTYRFFVAPDALQDNVARIQEPALLHQLTSVLRLTSGDSVTLLDNSGWEYTVVLEQVERSGISGTVEHKVLAETEPRLSLALYVALLRGERFEWVLQKGTELGVSEFVPMICERSVIDGRGDIGATKIERWERIIREAAEQSRRAKLPTLHPALPFDAACVDAARRARAFLLWEGEGAMSLRLLLRRPREGATNDSSSPERLAMALISGPEGGFAEHEIETAGTHQIELASLGPRILRAETAPVAAAAAVLFEHGDLD